MKGGEIMNKKFGEYKNKDIFAPNHNACNACNVCVVP